MTSLNGCISSFFTHHAQKKEGHCDTYMGVSPGQGERCGTLALDDTDKLMESNSPPRETEIDAVNRTFILQVSMSDICENYNQK